MTSIATDAQRRALARARWLAGGLLLLAAAIFVVTRTIAPPGFWTDLAAAGAEASLVGGLADWFAVTALFRHPLGLPIPHTAIIPASRDRIADGIGRFVAENFLEPDLVAARLGQNDLLGRAARWLGHPRNALLVAERIQFVLPRLVAAMQDRDLLAVLARVREGRGEGFDLAPVAGRALAALYRAGQHHALLDRAIIAARDWLAKNGVRVRDSVTAHSRWWVPRAFDRRMADALLGGIGELLDELARPDSDIRRDFDRWVGGLIAELPASDRWRTAVETLRSRLLDDPEVKAWLSEAFGRLKADLAERLDAEPERTRQMLARLMIRIARTLDEDPALRTRLGERLGTGIRPMVAAWRGEIGQFVADVVRGWEVREMAARIELAVGRDLQYVRVNGTIVGALVGCGLFLLRAFAF